MVDRNVEEELGYCWVFVLETAWVFEAWRGQ